MIVKMISLSLMVTIVEPRDFCNAFNSNDNNIGFGYKHNQRESESKLYLVIDRLFWELEFRDHQNDDYKQINFISMIGRESDWFWSEYGMGFCVHDKYNDYTTGLISKTTQTIYWGKFGGHQLYSSQCTGALQHQFYNFKPTLAFAINSNTNRSNTVCFLQQKLYGLLKFKRKVQCFRFNKDLTSKPQIIIFEPKVIQLLDPSLEVIAIFSQFSEKSSLIISKLRGNGFIILFKINQMIKYCYTCDQELSVECEVNRLKQLIDCSYSESYMGPIAYFHRFKTTHPILISSVTLALVSVIIYFFKILLKDKLKINFQINLRV